MTFLHRTPPATKQPVAPLARTIATYLGWLIAIVGVGLFSYVLLGIAGTIPVAPATDLGGLAVAGATLLLASFTLELALSTRSALEQAQSEFALERETFTEVQAQTAELKRQATATESALASSWRPILVDVPRGTDDRPLGGTQVDAASVVAWTDDATSQKGG